jgi:cell division protein FtsN
MGILIGMILGAIIVTAVVLFFNRNDNPFSQTSSTKQAEGTPAAAQQPGAAPDAAAGTQQMPASVVALPGKPGDRPAEKPDYSFFKTLPNGENAPVATPTPAGQPQPQPAAPPAQAAPAKQMYLQLAAFENAEQVDDLRARLLLMGLDRIVTQRAQLPDGRVVHRIRVGPFTDREDLKAMRARLLSGGFSAEEVSN